MTGLMARVEIQLRTDPVRLWRLRLLSRTHAFMAWWRVVP
jgi:hypothetical protein